MKKNEIAKTDSIIETQETSTEITIVDEENNKIKKTKKTPKKQIAKIPRKKLPKIYKKKYSKNKFKKKLLSKIFILDDKKYVESLFQEIKVGKKEKTFYRIPDEKLFTPVESKRLKVLAKQIKKQKGTVKLIPVFIILIIIASVILFTDLILKIGLKSTLQNAFKAKASIGYLHLDYLESSLTLKNLEVANKDAPMTNLFQFDSIILDIDINRLLEKSIVIDEIEASGFATGTQRETSGELIIKKKTSKKENDTPKEPIIKPEFIDNAKSKVTGELQSLFAKFDPDTIIKSVYNNLQTPVVSNSISTELATIVPYWQNKPTEISNEISAFAKEVDKVSNIDFSNIKDVKKIQENIDTLTNLVKSGEKLYGNVQTTYNKLNSDYQNVTKLSNNLQKAIQNDTKLASNITSSIKSFTPQNSMKILSNTLETFLNNVLGNFYPTIKEGLAFANEIKAKLPQKEKTEKTPEKKIERLDGTNFYWGRQEMPQFYVGKAHASGSGFDVYANNLSNNPSLIDKEMTLDGTYSIAQRQDSFYASLDLRETTQNPMFSASYHAPNVPTAFEFLTSDSTLDVQLTVEDDKSISIYGNANLSDANFVIPTFEPEFAYNICEKSVNQINSTYLGVLAGYDPDGKVSLNINTDFDNRFMRGITSLVNNELTSIKDKATKEITAKLEEYSTPIKAKIEEFNQYKVQIEKSKKELENKIAEVKAKIEDGKNKLVQYGKEQTQNAVSDAVNKYVDTSKVDSLKKWF